MSGKGVKKHKHYWCYPHAIIAGRKAGECVIVRYCLDCNQRNMAFVSRWRRARGDYARSEHYELPFD